MSHEIVPDSNNIDSAHGAIPFRREQSLMSGKHAGFSMQPPGSREIPDAVPNSGGLRQFVDLFAVAQGRLTLKPEIGDPEGSTQTFRQYGSAPHLNEIGGIDEP
jgi:hypothetical protein